MALILNWRLWLATGLLAASFAAGWGVNGWRLSSALQTLKTEQARQLAGSTLLRLVNAKDPAAAAQFDRWTKAGGVVLAGLVKRRASERAMFEGRS